MPISRATSFATPASLSTRMEDQLLSPDRATSAKSLTRPEPYVLGGYQSSDILLFDSANSPVRHGGSPSGSTLLQPNACFGLSALVHNDSTVAAYRTVVKFWGIPGGRIEDGFLIDVQTVDVAAGSTVRVDSKVPVVSALPGAVLCLAVSIYNSRSLRTNLDPESVLQLPWTLSGSRSSTAFRSTDSMLVSRGKPWRLSTTVYDEPIPGRISIEVNSSKFDVNSRLSPAELWVKVSPSADGSYSIEGETPWDARAGDRYLVGVKVTYVEKVIQFEEILYVGPDIVLKG